LEIACFRSGLPMEFKLNEMLDTLSVLL
jgi:hypothetical protein